MPNENNYVVYMHINKINGKKYIGITRQTPTRRWRNGDGYIRNPYFSRAIKKYGWDAFEHRILFRACSKEVAEAIEQDLIKGCHTQDHNKGYNIESGGSATPKVSEETRKRQSAMHKGVPSAFKGHHHTEEAKRKMSEAHKGKCFTAPRYGADNPFSKVIEGINKKTGEVVRIVGISEAGRRIGTQGSNISFCLSHPTRTAGGFYWREVKE